MLKIISNSISKVTKVIINSLNRSKSTHQIKSVKIEDIFKNDPQLGGESNPLFKNITWNETDLFSNSYEDVNLLNKSDFISIMPKGPQIIWVNSIKSFNKKLYWKKKKSQRKRGLK